MFLTPDERNANIVFKARLLPIEVGQVISICGNLSKGEVFDVALQSEHKTSYKGMDDFDDIMLNIRWEAGNIISRNAFYGGNWGQKEESQNLLPKNNVIPTMNADGTFKFDIYVDQACFFLTINSKPYCVFDHRQSISNIKQVVVRNDVVIYGISQNHPLLTTSPWPLINSKYFETTIPKRLKPGNAMIFTAKPTGNQDGSIVFSLIDCRRVAIVKLIAKLSEPEVKLEWDNNSIRNDEVLLKMNTPLKLGFAFGNRELQVALNGIPIGELPYDNFLHQHLNNCIGFTCTSVENSEPNFEFNPLSIEFMEMNVQCKTFACLTA